MVLNQERLSHEQEMVQDLMTIAALLLVSYGLEELPKSWRGAEEGCRA